MMSTLVQDLRITLRQMARRPGLASFAVLALALGLGLSAQQAGPPAAGPPATSPTLLSWPEGEYDRYLHDVQSMTRTRAGVATGSNGAVTVALNGLAARAGPRRVSGGSTLRSFGAASGPEPL